MTSLPDSPQRPVRDLEREAAVTRLQNAYVEGQLTHQEMDERLHRALTATTPADLAAATAALPAEEPAPVSTITAATGRITRRGAWRVPRTLKVDSAFGRVRLDLSRAVIDHPVTDIEINIGTGRARITLPRNAVVDFEGVRTTWKDLRYRPPRHRPTPDAPVIRLTGVIGFGRLKIRHAKH
ncbi:DUF1707 domain-containing protein [Kitasatospora sp. NPDC049285]|uniref:DUF1707 SHOCT-like domain-containing protein n=1 Tax=Kitasatospora sp. NPDC049285 TaxID=3157096 RepID=UPI00343AE9C0